MPADLTVADSWILLQKRVSVSAPDVWADFRAGATEADIAATEKKLGVTFPGDLRESMKIHDGQSRDGPAIAASGSLLSLDTIVSEWKIWMVLLEGGDFGNNTGDGDGAAKSVWWSPRWIPLTFNGAGDHECLDLDPDTKGQSGQILQMWHDDSPRKVTAPSFRAWLSKLARAVESGELVYADEYGCFMPADEI